MAAALSDANLAASFKMLPGSERQTEINLLREGALLAPFATVNGSTLLTYDTNGAIHNANFHQRSPGSIGLEDYSSTGTIDFSDLILSYDNHPLV